MSSNASKTDRGSGHPEDPSQAAWLLQTIPSPDLPTPVVKAAGLDTPPLPAGLLYATPDRGREMKLDLAPPDLGSSPSPAIS